MNLLPRQNEYILYEQYRSPLVMGGTLQEQEAIRQCQAGELEAQGILYKLHYQAVFRTAYGLTRNYDLAEDVTQEVFIELFTAIKRYDPRRPFAPWLHGIAAHKSLDRIRNSPKWKVVPIADADNIPSLNPSPEDFVVRSELAEAIWAEVGTLRPKQQAVVVLYYYKPGFPRSNHLSWI
jgi:RNA polymerase sigma-70 factor (ECF subfamily)